jgi:hypothetical protein
MLMCKHLSVAKRCWHEVSVSEGGSEVEDLSIWVWMAFVGFTHSPS